jgi:hypothetical protein
MASYPALGRLNEIAEDQWGLVTRRQALNAGVGQTTIDRLTADGSVMRRVAHGVYRMVGAPEPDHLQLRAAWLQLEPAIMGWERGPSDGVVSHRSAADMYGLGHLPEDQHDFTVDRRRQSRRSDVRVHRRHLGHEEWIMLRGLPVTRPARTASDLLYDREDPAAVAHVVSDALRAENEQPGLVVDALAPHAARFGLRKGDGLALLQWLLNLVGDPATTVWMSEARAHIRREAATTGSPEDLIVESAA